MVVPTNVLLFRGEGTRVAMVDAPSHVRLKPVTLGRNLGESIEVLDGISSRRTGWSSTRPIRWPTATPSRSRLGRRGRGRLGTGAASALRRGAAAGKSMP